MINSILHCQQNYPPLRQQNVQPTLTTAVIGFKHKWIPLCEKSDAAIPKASPLGPSFNWINFRQTISVSEKQKPKVKLLVLVVLHNQIIEKKNAATWLKNRKHKIWLFLAIRKWIQHSKPILSMQRTQTNKHTYTEMQTFHTKPHNWHELLPTSKPVTISYVLISLHNESQLGLYWIADFTIWPNKNNSFYYSAEYE